MIPRRARGKEQAFSIKMNANERNWRAVMKEVAGDAHNVESTSLPDPLTWREDLRKLSTITGLRREEFGRHDETSFIKVVARIATPARLPDTIPPMPYHFVKPVLVDEVRTALLDDAKGDNMARRLVLMGMGGAGKTVIAAAIARDESVRRHFRDGVLWLNDEHGQFNEEILVSQLRALARQFQDVVLSRHYRQGRTFQYDPVEFKDWGHAGEFFVMWRRKFNLRCLLVVDGAWHSVRHSRPAL